MKIQGKLQNFSPCVIKWKDYEWYSAEQAFQFFKARVMGDKDMERRIATETNPKEAKRLGRNAHGDILRWNEKRVDAMRWVLQQKFAQNPVHKATLMATGDQHLEEIAPWDSFWGTGRDGNGKNMLGQLLEEIRNNM